MNQRPERPARRQPRISRPSKRSVGESGQKSPLKYLVAVVAILLTFVAVQTLRSSWKQPDPHFVAAEKMVSGYEMGREQADRNYRHPVYREALSKLKRVNSRSISAEPAAELSARIVRETSLFELRRESAREIHTAAIHDRRARAKDAAASVLAAAMVMPPSFIPECEESESHDHDDDDDDD
jgi:hypothetical protein